MKVATVAILVLAASTLVTHAFRGAVRLPRREPPAAPKQPVKQPAIQPVCGDGVCDPTESIETCKEDCQPRPRFSVESVRPELLPKIAEIGDGLSGAQGLVMLNWGVVEPSPPVGGKHNYRALRPQDAWWAQTLSVLKKTGRNLNCTILVDRAEWALERSETMMVTDSVTGQRMPGLVGIKPEHMGDWKAFIKHFLTTTPPVTFIQIDSEPDNTWVDASGYVKVLRAAHDAVQEFNREHPGRNVKVLAAGFNLGRLIHIPDAALRECVAQYPNVDVARIVKAWPEVNEGMVPLLVQKLAMVDGTLRLGRDAFDILTLHNVNDKTYDTIGEVVAWYRRRMQSYGYQKPIWLDDFASNYFHLGIGKDVPAEAQKLNRGLARGDAKVVRAYTEMHSRWLLRKAVGDFAAGIDRISIVYEGDIPAYFMPQWRYMGLFTAEGRAKPAYYTAKLMVQKLDYFVRAQTVGPYAYRFTFANKPDVFVAWSETGRGSLDLGRFMPKGKARLTFIVSRLGEDGQPVARKAEVVPANAIPLTEDPVFIEEI